jgi:16S rRNA processing protein RimM
VTSSSALEIGYVRRTFGARGEVAIRCFDPGSLVLATVKRVQLRLKDGTVCELSIGDQRRAPQEFIVQLESVSTLSDSKRLVGARVSVFREDLEPPAEGEFFQGDLVGLAAVTESGEPLGKVAEIWNTGPVPNLVIRNDSGSELIVPFADEFVPQVDLAAGRLVVRPIEFME